MLAGRERGHLDVSWDNKKSVKNAVLSNNVYLMSCCFFGSKLRLVPKVKKWLPHLWVLRQHSEWNDSGSHSSWKSAAKNLIRTWTLNNGRQVPARSLEPAVYHQRLQRLRVQVQGGRCQGCQARKRNVLCPEIITAIGRDYDLVLLYDIRPDFRTEV